MSHLAKFQIKQLRQENLAKMAESIAVYIFTLVTSSFLPPFLLRYVYAADTLTEQPKLLEFMPIAAFVLGTAYFLYAIVGNFMRSAKIKQLEKQVMMDGDMCCNGCTVCQCDDHSNCSCGSCDTMSMERDSASTSQMAASMKSMSKKKSKK